MKSSANLDWLRILAKSPSTSTTLSACFTPNYVIGVLYSTFIYVCYFPSRAADLERVLTVKLEALLNTCDTPIIYDPTRLGTAFRDLKKAVCGRNKLEVTYIITEETN